MQLLEGRQWFVDVLIDFGLQYSRSALPGKPVKEGNGFSWEDVYIFSTYFYTNLSAHRESVHQERQRAEDSRRARLARLQ